MFYHGTTDALSICDMVLPPTVTSVQREYRVDDTDKVFFTNSAKSARYYAKKAAMKFGGNPILLVIEPIGWYIPTNNTEFISQKAKIVGRLKCTVRPR